MKRTWLVVALLLVGTAPSARAQGTATGRSWWDTPPPRAATATATATLRASEKSGSPSAGKPKTTTLATADATRSFWGEPVTTTAAPKGETAKPVAAAAPAKATPANTSTAPAVAAPRKAATPPARAVATPQARRQPKVRVVFADTAWSDVPTATTTPAAPTTSATPEAAPAPRTDGARATDAPAEMAPAATTAAPAAAPAPAPAAAAAPAPAPATEAAAALPIKIPALTGAIIRVNDETSFRFGVLFQGQADWQQVAAGGDAQQNLFLRRMRLMFGATIANRFSFFAETDNPNLGKSTGTSKTISSGLLLQDAFFGYRPVENLDIWAGLIIIPLCRNCMQSATSLMAMDYGAFSFLQSTPTTSAVGRDTGFLARAYGFKKHLEVRLGAFQGVRQAGSTNGFRYAGRVQYSFGDPDVVQMFYGGSTFGAKRMVVVGGGFDRQDDYQAVAGDITVDQPLGPGAVYLQFDAIRYDGGTFLKTLPRQTDLLFEGAYYLKKMKLAPYVQVAMQRFDAEALKAGDQTRTQIGVTYLLKGNNANLKAGYLFVGNNGKDPLKGFTVQFQTFFY